MHTIGLIGAGQLGSRHLQGLAKINFPVSLSVIDPSAASLKLAEERFAQVPDSFQVTNIEYSTSIDNLPRDLDLVIIATTANIRAAVTHDLLLKKNVKAILFEKVVFQKENDFTEIAQKLDQRAIKAWVNCPRRLYPFYREVKSWMRDDDKISFTLQGGEWGLACNAIHFLDLIAYLSGDHEVALSIDGLDEGFLHSSRKDFLEMTGTLLGRLSKGSEFALHARRGSTAPHIITLLSSRVELIIDEGRGLAFIARKDSSWEWKEMKFHLPYQSELTNLVAQDILVNGSCELPTLNESSLLHRPFLITILRHLEAATGQMLEACPIT